MTDRPIIFSAPMVRALLEGRKTQTRRVLKPQPENASPALWPGCCRPYYAPGDRLWVRETWAHERLSPDPDNPDNPDPAEPMLLYRASYSERRGVESDGMSGGVYYGATAGAFDCISLNWRSPVTMPRWASRITLTVTDARVQLLQQISEADAIAEGLPDTVDRHHERHVIGWFRDLWITIHGPDVWDANPWVAALTFTAERRNIDEESGDR